MFCCGGGGSSSTDTPEAAAAALKAKQLAKEQVKEMSKDVQVTKILLLGAGESGKSTIFKQMKILYGEPTMNQDDLNLVRSIIYNNTITTMQTILEYCETFELKGQVLPENEAHFQKVMEADENDDLDDLLGD